MIAMRVPGWFGCYLLVVLLWGGSYALTEIALTAFSPGQVALWRALLGAGALLVAALVTGRGRPRLEGLGVGRILLLAALTTAASLAATTAQQRMPSGMVAVLCATTPLFAVFLHRFTGGRVPTATWAGVLLGVCGVAVLFSPDGHVDSIAVLLGLVAAGSVALAGFLAGIFVAGKEFSGVELTTAHLFFSGLLLVPVTVGDAAPPAATGIGPLASLVGLGVLGAAVGNVLYWRVLREAGPVMVSTTYQTVPLVAVAVGFVGLGERFGTSEAIGATLILTGLGALLLGNRHVLKYEDTGIVNHRVRTTDRQAVTAAASLTTSPEKPPAQRKTEAKIMTTTTITRIAAGLIAAAGLALGAAPAADAEAGVTADTTTQSDTSPWTGPTGLNGNLPGRSAPDTGFDQFGHLPFNPAMPGGD